MSVPSTSKTPNKYPTPTAEPEKKSNIQPVPPSSEVSDSAPRMSSRRARTRTPQNLRHTDITQSSSNAPASTEPTQIASGASSTITAETSAPREMITTAATSKSVTFNPDVNITKYLKKHGKSFDFSDAVTSKREFINNLAEHLSKIYDRLDKHSSQPLGAETPLLSLGKLELKKLAPRQSDSDPSLQTIASYYWLVEATLGSDDDTLKAFFDLAVEFREKGIDLPSLIVNLAIDNNNHEFLKRLNNVCPNTNLHEYLKSKR